MENSAEYYYEKLKSDDRPGAVLASLYCSLYNTEVTRSEIIVCNKLVKVFGRFTVYFAILDMVGSKPDALESPYAYLYEICKRRFENMHIDATVQAREDLSKYIARIDEEIQELEKNRKKIKIPSSEGLEIDGRQ